MALPTLPALLGWEGARTVEIAVARYGEDVGWAGELLGKHAAWLEAHVQSTSAGTSNLCTSEQNNAMHGVAPEDHLFSSSVLSGLVSACGALPDPLPVGFCGDPAPACDVCAAAGIDCADAQAACTAGCCARREKSSPPCTSSRRK